MLDELAPLPDVRESCRGLSGCVAEKTSSRREPGRTWAVITTVAEPLHPDLPDWTQSALAVREFINRGAASSTSGRGLPRRSALLASDPAINHPRSLPETSGVAHGITGDPENTSRFLNHPQPSLAGHLCPASSKSKYSPHEFKAAARARAGLAARHSIEVTPEQAAGVLAGQHSPGRLV